MVRRGDAPTGQAPVQPLFRTHFEQPERVPDVVERRARMTRMDLPRLAQESRRPAVEARNRLLEQRGDGHAQGRAESMDALRYDRGLADEVVESVPADLGAPQGFAQGEPTCPRQGADLAPRQLHSFTVPHECTATRYIHVYCILAAGRLA